LAAVERRCWKRLLGQLPGVTPLGEVVHLWQRDLRDDERCGCGDRFSACGFWQKVGVEAFGGWDAVDPQRVLDLADKVERTRFIPRLAFGRRPPGVEEYAAHYAKIYNGAATVTGATAVVDSSKHSALAYCLRHAEIDLRVIHVVRDSRGVAYSWTKKVMRPEAETDEEMTRYSPEPVGAAVDRAQRVVRAARPAGRERAAGAVRGTARRPDDDAAGIARFAGLRRRRRRCRSSRRPTTASSADLGPSHSAAGNPMRFTFGTVPLRRDEAWRRSLPRGQRRLVGALTAPLPVRVTAIWDARHEVALRRRDHSDPGAGPSCSTARSGGRGAGLRRRGPHGGGLRPGDARLPARPRRRPPLMVLVNCRTPGLAGARNTGILALDTDLVAFCDDDDTWRRQAAPPGRRLRDGEFATCAMNVRYGEACTPALAGLDRVDAGDLVRSRMAMLHASSFLIRRERSRPTALGLVAEDAPGSQNEDWDLLLRAASGRRSACRRAPDRGGVGPHLVLRAPVRHQDLVASLDDGAPPRDRSRRRRRGPGLRPAGLLVGGARRPEPGDAVRPAGRTVELARAAGRDRPRRAVGRGAGGERARGPAQAGPWHLKNI
jgi:glycosyltransferase involved in cell wall biosynthesis